jgi:hypothetical protein
VCQRQLDGLSNLLLLHVQTTNVGVSDIWLLILTQHSNRGVCFGRKDVDERVGVSVEGDRGGRLQLLTVECGKDADDVVGAGRALNDTSTAIAISIETIFSKGKAYF